MVVTSQAKGRIERLWETFQDRLVMWFKLNKIKTIDEANEFLKKYIKNIIKRFQLKQKVKKVILKPYRWYIYLQLFRPS